MANILVAGGGGFIGSHFVDQLYSDGHEVAIIDSFCSSDRRNINHLEGENKIHLFKRDILDELPDIEVDYVVHMASRASPKDYQQHPVHTIRTNTEGTLNLLRFAAERDASFMFTSTSEVYGDPEVHPQHEDYWGHVNPVGPRACYDEGKRCGEATITSFVKNHPLDYRIVRIFNTYGPRMRPDDGRVISNFATQALRGGPLTVYGDGSQTRSFCYVDDMVEGLMAAMESPNGEIVNLGNPNEVSIIDLADKIRAQMGEEVDLVHEELPEDDPERRKPDISRAKELLGWAPETPLDAGMERTIRYFRDRT